ncbi:hypothetical protein CARUB_v10003141mg [Capsella rubella]|uniref:Uncharacterized protein n=1 Tax=Capsella rubella TaxID=81985 RepID=R0HFG5_9BRAS|nr:hypothetical protein CARUB_v10003141mg [Capsella rubella]
MKILILTKIVSYVVEEGVGELKNWIRTEKEGKLAVMSPETLAVVSLLLAFRVGDLNESLIVIETVKDVYPVAELAYYMLLSCAVCLNTADLLAFKNEYCYESHIRNADTLMFHIYIVGQRRCETFSEKWHFFDFPK